MRLHTGGRNKVEPIAAGLPGSCGQENEVSPPLYRDPSSNGIFRADESEHAKLSRICRISVT